MNELEQLEIYQDATDAKYSTEESINYAKFGSKLPRYEADKLKSSYILPSRILNSSTPNLCKSYLNPSRRYLESIDNSSRTPRMYDSHLDISPYSNPQESDRLKELRKSTHLSIRKTIDELERQLINRKSITPNKSLLDNNQRLVLNMNTSFMDTDGAEDRPTDNLESPQSVFTDFKAFESFRKDSDECLKNVMNFKSPAFGLSKKFVFEENRVMKQDSVCITPNTSGLGCNNGRNLEEEYFLMVMY